MDETLASLFISIELRDLLSQHPFNAMLEKIIKKVEERCGVCGVQIENIQYFVCFKKIKTILLLI